MSGPSTAGVWMLAVGQTLAYAAVFYIFAALVLSVEADLGWDKRLLALGPLLAIGVSAVVAPVAGKAVDAGFGRALLAGGAVWGAVVLAALSQVTTPSGWLAGWAALGLAQAACLYEVTFAWLIRRFGVQARSRIVKVTLVAGLASTLAFPAGAALAGQFGWRGAMAVAAVVMLLGVAPLHILGCRLIRAQTPGVAEADTSGTRAIAVLWLPAFWCLAAIFTLIGLNHWMLVSFLVPLLVERGVEHGAAVLAAALVGPAQTAGRLVLMRFEARVSTAAAIRWVLAGIVLSGVVLLAAGASVPVTMVFAVLQGASLGTMTILRPVWVAEVLGHGHFGQVNGMLSIASLGASALAPLAAAALFEGYGPSGIVLAALISGVAALALGLRLNRGSAGF